jgi:hypothetical protein
MKMFGIWNKYSQFVFCVTNEDEGITVYIGDIKTWRRRKALSDRYSDRQRRILEPIISSLGLDEIMECTFIANNSTYDAYSLKNRLIKLGFTYDVDFENFILKCNAEDCCDCGCNCHDDCNCCSDAEEILINISNMSVMNDLMENIPHDNDCNCDCDNINNECSCDDNCDCNCHSDDNNYTSDYNDYNSDNNDYTSDDFGSNDDFGSSDFSCGSDD